MTKFISLAEKHTLACLKELAFGNPENASELIQALKKSENLEPIWHVIRHHVKTELWDEFKEAYGNNPENQHFKELIEYGKQLAIPSEAKLNLILQPSQAAHGIFKSGSNGDEEKEPNNEPRKP